MELLFKVQMLLSKICYGLWGVSWWSVENFLKAVIICSLAYHMFCYMLEVEKTDLETPFRQRDLIDLFFGDDEY